MNKALIVYFSQTGNTQIAAEKIHQLTGADIFRLKAKTPYQIHQVMQWSDRVDVEGKTSAFPELQAKISNWQKYSLIYLGFPIWFWGAPTRIMATVFKDYDFKDKKVAPFFTSYSTDPDQAISKLKAMTDQEILFLPGYRYEGNDQTLQNWLRRIQELDL